MSTGQVFVRVAPRVHVWGETPPNSIRYHKGGKKHGQDMWGWEVTSKDRGRAGGAQQQTKPGHKAGLLSDREYLNGT